MHNQGYLLTEVIFAMLLSIVTTIVLLDYFNSLRYQFHFITQQQQLWRYAHLLLESYPHTDLIILPQYCQLQITETSVNGCRWITVKPCINQNESVMLSRLFCHL